MAGFRVRDPLVQERLDQDYAQHPLVIRMNTLDQGSMSDAQYLTQKRNYLVFLIAHHHYEAYLRQREGIQRRDHLQNLRAQKLPDRAGRGPGLGLSSLAGAPASLDSGAQVTPPVSLSSGVPASLVSTAPAATAASVKGSNAEIITTLTSAGSHVSSAPASATPQPTAVDSAASTAQDGRKTLTAKRK
ncbi:ORF65 [Retroperitoneal fibromatosis-associated herpesvirus]|uniref:Small capsomere-interacting protein n=1 Tax=Retroperitoneal fibromatosis-associated herpesvirus TaxID=111469 RepID=U5NIZ5_9GAMA|nr:ORF65 [Retroperitoneal fibromatosis-associated herpesvirus]AGY30751.1 ORF65 [Retroperitoneal fibromatosis-associated herpesvirus]